MPTGFKTRGSSATNIVSLPNSAFRYRRFLRKPGAPPSLARLTPAPGATSFQARSDPSSPTTTIQRTAMPRAFQRQRNSRRTESARPRVRSWALLPQTNTEAVLNNAFLPSQPSFNNFNDYTIRRSISRPEASHERALREARRIQAEAARCCPRPSPLAGDTIWSWRYWPG